MILAFDPSGNWSKTEGKGTSGWAVFDDDGKLHAFGDIKAAEHNSIEEYWHRHSLLVREMERLSRSAMGPGPFTVVWESYRLQAGKAKQQSWSSLETPQLIGHLRMVAWELETPFVFQDPSIKARFSDEILVSSGIAEKRGKMYYINGKLTNDHMRDAIRHGLYFSGGVL